LVQTAVSALCPAPQRHRGVDRAAVSFQRQPARHQLP
jgi:hypothetical protein